MAGISSKASSFGNPTNRLKYKGKEQQSQEFTNGSGLEWTDFGARMYDNQIGRWHVVDPLAEKYIETSPYTFVKNNPINNIEIDGREFDEKNEKKAKKIEAKVEKRIAKVEKEIAKLEKKGKDIGDRKERVGEMRKTLSDVGDMRKDDKNKYVFASASQNDNKPETKRTGSGEITIFTDNFSKQIHEARHGGQIARDEYDVSTSGTIIKGTFGASKEVDAYRAQYGYDGFIQYLPDMSTMSQDKLKSAFTPGPSGLTYDIRLLQDKLLNINAITPNLLRNFFDLKGLIQTPVYPDVGNFYNQ